MRPSAITATRSPRTKASPWSWVTNTVDTPSAVSSRRTSARTCTRRAVSRFENGSSRSSTPGSGARARASATRCCWPPESVPGSRSPRPSRPTIASAWSTRAGPGPAGQAVGDVRGHGHVREQGPVLEHHADLAPLGRHPDRVARQHPPAGCGPRPRRAARALRSCAAASSCRTRSVRGGRRPRRGRPPGRRPRGRGGRRRTWPGRPHRPRPDAGQPGPARSPSPEDRTASAPSSTAGSGRACTTVRILVARVSAT